MANTLQQIESVQQVFPNISRNQIRLDLDTSQKKLATETGSLTVRSSLSNISTNFAWVLPSGFLRLNDLVLYDPNNNPKYLSDYNYKYEIELGKLFIYSLTGTPITGLSTEISTVYIHYERLPETLTNESTSMEIVEQFRDAIESDVLSKYFGKFPIDYVSGGQVVKTINLQLAQWHEARYEKLRIKLKKYFNGLEVSSGIAQNYQHAGHYILPKRPNDSSTGSIVSIAALSDLYTKYAYFKTTNADSGVIAPILSLGYSTISASLSGDTLIVSSSSEFDEETIIIPNNNDAGWKRDSTSQYTVTLPSGWTTFAFDIYERD